MKFRRPLPKFLTDAQFAYLLLVPLLLFQTGLTIYPILFSLWLSLHEYNPLAQIFRFAGVEMYSNAINDPSVINSLRISLHFSFTVVILSIALGFAMALILNEEFHGRGIVRATTLLPWAVPEYALAVIFAFIYSQTYGTLNGLLYQLGFIEKYIPLMTRELAVYLVALAYSWHFAPLGAFFLLGALQTIPEDLYKQAKVDGAGPIRRFWYITLRHLKYSFLIVLILATAESFKAFDLIFLLTGGGPATATQVFPYLIYRETFHTMRIGYGSALSWILTLVILVITMIYFLALTRPRRRG